MASSDFLLKQTAMSSQDQNNFPVPHANPARRIVRIEITARHSVSFMSQVAGKHRSAFVAGVLFMRIGVCMGP